MDTKAARAADVVGTLIEYLTYGLMIFTALLILLAFVPSDTQGEANTGSFESLAFNDGWSIYKDGALEGTLKLPSEVPAASGDIIELKNTLPGDLSDGMNLFFRTNLEDVYVLIDGKVRESYATENFESMSYYIPSAYVVAPLSSDDSGREVTLRIRVKSVGIINEVSLSHGNNTWFKVILHNGFLAVIAIVVVVTGLCAVLFYVLFTERLSIGKAMLYLGLFMSSAGAWAISESKLRQLIFARPSLSTYFSFLTIEILPVLLCLYFDEVQKKRYHKMYLTIETLTSMQIILCLILNVAKAAELYRTLVLSHVCIGIGVICILFTLINDMRTGRFREYLCIFIGTGLFMLTGVLELISFYAAPFNSFGIFLCIGLILFLAATIIQLVTDSDRKNTEREQQKEDSLFNTIETITSAIDAKDEYTGGHSERVGEYAGILAREMAADYGFSEEDILRIHYIGLMHDIGKIGVADNVLNKVGRLSDEEFTLMKKHTEIGYDLLRGMENTMDGLLDGIRYHHERFDGSGYPDGLEGTDIPLVARILCLADSYDAMTSNRVYRNRLSDAEVMEEIRRCSGKQFDPAIAEIFLRILERGDFKPSTVNGMETDETGGVLISSVIDKRMLNDMHIEKLKVLNPSHIRMLCYIMKLADKSARSYDVFYAKIVLSDVSALSDKEKSAVKKSLNARIKELIGTRDISIEYTGLSNIVALFDRTTEEFKELERLITDIPDTEGFTVSLEHIHT